MSSSPAPSDRDDEVAAQGYDPPDHEDVPSDTLFGPRPPRKRPRVTFCFYRNGSQRGPLVYFKRPGIVRLQGLRRGVLICWLGWL